VLTRRRTVCLQPWLQGARYDPSLHLHEDLPVRSKPSNFERTTLNWNLTDIFYSVGDIVDLKVNGAVQKGSVQFRNFLHALSPDRPLQSYTMGNATRGREDENLTVEQYAPQGLPR
jgi:hypothetical protein